LIAGRFNGRFDATAHSFYSQSFGVIVRVVVALVILMQRARFSALLCE
jgi:hypothetical protein